MTAGGPLRFHHARSLANVRHGTVAPVRLTELIPRPDCSGGCEWSDAWHEALVMEATYKWLAGLSGFWPLFLAVGETDEDRRMTAYQLQFSRSPKSGPRGPIRERVMFSYHHPPPGTVYLDYMNWHIPLNSLIEQHGDPHRLAVQLRSRGDQAAVLKRSWPASRWLRYARQNPHCVQAAVPELNLAAADEIWVPNQRIAHALHQQGFPPERITVRRLTVTPDRAPPAAHAPTP